MVQRSFGGEMEEMKKPEIKTVNPEEEIILEEKIKEELENISKSTTNLVKKIVSDYRTKMTELQDRCESLEQENLELKYKLRQLSNDLKSLSEKIASEFIQRSGISIESGEKI